MPAPGTFDDASIAAIAEEMVALLGTDRQIEPISRRHAGFDLPAAYRVNAAVRRLRERRGETPIGRKIGFTNPRIWSEYGVYAPIWSYVYDRTVYDLAEASAPLSLASFAEPRIEPEIVFKLAAPPDPAMDPEQLLACIDWLAPAFEIVQSVFPGWKFAASDTVAAFGLHGVLLLGPRCAPGACAWALADFGITLSCDGHVTDEGRSENVLGGPLNALDHLVKLLGDGESGPRLAAGEIVSTGTLTRALPAAAGQRWRADFSGIDLPAIACGFAA